MSVRVERAGNRILLASESPTPGLARSIPGAYFRKDSLWSVPLDLTTCHLLRERFGNRLVIGPALTAWAREEKARRAEATEVAAADDAEIRRLPEVAPVLHRAMSSRRYQRAAVRFVADTLGRDGRKRALIADTVGLGKTAEAIGAVLEAGIPGPYLVICPKTAVLGTWKPEIHRWLPDAEVIAFPDGRSKRDEMLTHLASRTMLARSAARSLQRSWVVIHPAMVRTQTWFICHECGDKTKYTTRPVHDLDCGHEKDRRTKVQHDHTFPQLFGIEWGAVIADESDQILIRLSGTPNLQRRGMEMLGDLVAPEGMRIAMSGTPFRSKPHQMWSTLNWLDPKRWSSKWSWIQRYWQTGGYSGYEIVQDGFIEEREALMLDDLKDVMIRRRREDVRDDLPPKLYPSNVPEDSGLTPGIYLPMTSKQERAYQELVKQGSAEIEGGRLNPIGILAEMTRMKQLAGAEGKLVAGSYGPCAGGNKYEWLVEFMLAMGFPDKTSSKLVIASQFTQLLNAFRIGVEHEFGTKRQHLSTGMVTGETNAKGTAQRFINEFEDPDSDLNLLLLNTKAGGSSITLDAAEVMVVLDETWVADEQEQLEGRIDNRQPERRIVPRSYYYLRSRGTIEETIAAANAEAKRVSGRILDGAAIAKQAKELVK